MRRIAGRAALAFAAVGAVLVAPLALAGPSAGDGAPEGADPRTDSTVGTPAQPYIVGGERTSTSEYPWAVALTTPASEAAYCGGALVAADKVLTAAHCVSGYMLPSIRVAVGRTDLRTDEGEERSVLRAWVHPDYRAPEQGHDVAVLTLDQPVRYDTIPVESDRDVYRPGRLATVLGWGYTAEGGPSSPMLRQVEVPLVDDDQCAATYREFDSAIMVCAGDPQGGMDACYGDSGGPLIVGNRLIGITSWGSGCARESTPGVFVRITAYHDEIAGQLD